MALIHLCFEGDSPLGYVKTTVFPIFFSATTALSSKMSQLNRTVICKDFSQYISKYMALKICSLKYFEQCIYCIYWYTCWPLEQYVFTKRQIGSSELGCRLASLSSSLALCDAKGMKEGRLLTMGHYMTTRPYLSIDQIDSILSDSHVTSVFLVLVSSACRSRSNFPEPVGAV